MLIELAIGDAYGAGFEYADPQPPARSNDLTRYVRHPRHRLRPGSYTDDTQMSLAVAEMIVSGLPWARENLAGKFLEAFIPDRGCRRERVPPPDPARQRQERRRDAGRTDRRLPDA